MFSKRHEHELSEIKAMTYELRRRFEEIVQQLGQIQEAQDQLAARAQAGAAAGTTEAAPAEAAAPAEGSGEIRTVHAGRKPGKPRTKGKGGGGKRRGAGGRQALPLAESTQIPDSHEG